MQITNQTTTFNRQVLLEIIVAIFIFRNVNVYGFLVGKSVDDEMLDTMLKTSNTALFTQGIIADTQQAKLMLSDVQARHNDIIKLEASIAELHDMFLDMCVMVESQGEVLNNIERNVNSTQDYVDSAKTNTQEAKVSQSKARKKKFICGIIGGVLVLVVIGVIVLAVLI